MRSRLLRELLKAGDRRLLGKYIRRVGQQITDDSPLAGFLHADQVLVPVPGSSPARSGAPSVAERLANALVDAGLGREVWCGLQRLCAVPKSATAVPGARPTVRVHYDSFAVRGLAAAPAQIVLIDDVVTKGRTLLAAATRVRDAFPAADIRAFALLRTLGFAADIDQVLAPCVGEIRWRGGDAHRAP